jgi:CBS domain-containing protein
MLRNLVKITEDATIETMFKILYERHVGSVVVTDNDERCKGIFTETDAIRAVATKVPLNTQVGEIMTKNVITIWEGASFAEAKQLYQAQNIRHLPVVDESHRLIGMLSIRNILDELVGL